jgi:hypothetical protein
MLKLLKLFVLAIFLCAGLTAVASGKDSLKKERYQKSAAVYYQVGNVILTHAFVKGDNPNHEAYGLYQSYSLKYGIHTDGRQLWEQLYGYPVWGFGFYQAFYLNDNDELGSPLALYSFIDLPLKRYKKWSLDFEIGFGLAGNWNTHELLEDHYYYPIGSFATVFIDAGLNATFPLGNHFYLSGGLTFTHFSNGAVKLPNLGVNMGGARIELQYTFKERPAFIKETVAGYLKEWEWIALIAPSMRQVAFEYVDEVGDTIATAFDYGILSFSTSINRQISHKVKFGAGADISYNTAYGADTVMVNGIPEKAPYTSGEKILIGVYPSFELVMGKFSILAQPGFYVYQTEIDGYLSPSTYQRVGMKYHFWDHLVVGINIRAINFSVADFIEWNIGYRIKWQKSYRKEVR